LRRARRNAIDVYATIADLERDGSRERENRAFRCRIAGKTWRTFVSELRRCIDDPAKIARVHQRQYPPCHQESAAQMYGDDAVPLLDRHRLYGRTRSDPRVVHEYVDMAECVDRSFNQSRAFRIIADVGLYENCVATGGRNLSGNFARRRAVIGIRTIDDDTGAFAGEGQSDSTTNASSTASDDGNTIY
jgi:hypothetical protein